MLVKIISPEIKFCHKTSPGGGGGGDNNKEWLGECENL